MNIMIVDDEFIFRDYLRQALDWDRYGFRIAGEAKNGMEALKLADEGHYDMALIDINMPIMDGLQLCEKLKEKHPHVDVVIITGHNEFEYARKAIRLGVEDYILKPFSKDELVLTLLKCRQKQKQSLEAKQTEQADRQLMVDSVMYRLVTGDSSERAEPLKERLEQWGISLGGEGETYSVACIEIDHMERRWNEAAERELWKFAVSNILSEAFGSEGTPLLFNGPEGRIVCLRTDKDPNLSEGVLTKLDSYEELIFSIRKYLKLTVTIGVGRRYKSLVGIRRSYEEARDALRQKFLLGDDKVIPYSEQTSESREAPAFLQDSNEMLQRLLRTGDLPGLERKLDELFASIHENMLSLDMTYVSCMGWISICLSHVTELGHPIEDCFGEHFFPYSEIRTMQTAESVKGWIKSLFINSLDYVNRHKTTRSTVIAGQARTYIEKNYQDPELSVENVAASSYINASYLRALFKKAFGMTVGEYITHTRMSRAKELLGANIRLSEIAERVGYQDAGYFSKVFKKFYGTTPSEYENGLLRNKG
ncbi:response regulator [Cohnella endophytica]|uniref:Response regulator n=1 Tax=Cohnella endophytica TaxID=2419778 RepID=A0A494X9B9_9BACL|nr:response regulator [Cohnella endophytica]RKP47305.1 response regulator [Cohnella endophytica]